MNIDGHRTKAFSLVLILLLTIGAIEAITPVFAVRASVSTSKFTLAFNPIGINQLQTISLTVSPALTNVRSIQEEDLLYDAYWKIIRPDGTDYTIDGPLSIDRTYSQYIVAEFEPDQVGDWTVQFYWDGDPKYYEPAFGETTFVVQQEPVATTREVDPWLFVRPNPIGLGQILLVEMGVVPRPILPGDVYKDFYIKFTKADGTTDTIGPLTSYPDSTQWLEYTVDQVGDWTVQFLWDGGKYEEPRDQPEIAVTVQEEQIPSPPVAQFPTESWNYPINVENREWYQLTGPWFQNLAYNNYDASRSAFNPYSEAPRSSHILWNQLPYSGVGGMVGGAYGTGVYFDQSAIEFVAVMAGKGYYNAGGQIHCVDIRTGEELWAKEGAFNFGAFEVGSVTSAMPILVSISSPAGRLIKYDALSGEKILDVEGFKGMTSDDRRVFDPLGGYIVDCDKGANYILKYTFLGDTEFFEDRIAWNVTFPFEGATPDDMKLGLDYEADTLIDVTYDIYSESGAIDYTTGETLWKRFVPGIQSRNSNGFGFGQVYHTVDGRRIRAIDARTGEIAWTTEQMAEPWGNYWAYSHAAAYDTIYKLGYAGVHAFDADTGELNWVFTSGDAGYQTPYGTWPFYLAPAVADGVVFATTSEHSPTLPIYTGQKLFAIDSFEGTEIWSIMGTIAPSIVAEGILFASDEYTGVSYAFSKGPTETTVAVSTKVAASGAPILIEGTIMDQSPAQEGTPAVSEDSMTAWMEYLHMQQPKPANATGVSVHVTAIDPNGNFQDIGYATSDLFGNYALSWTPPVSGVYSVKATFEGSASYYSSEAGTTFAVSDISAATPTASPASPTPTNAPATTPTESAPTAAISPSPVVQPPTSAMPTTTYLAIAVVAVIIIITAAALVLRKRK